MPETETAADALQRFERAARAVKDATASAWEAADLTLEGPCPTMRAEAGGLPPADAARVRELVDRAERAAWEWDAVCTALWDLCPAHPERAGAAAGSERG